MRSSQQSELATNSKSRHAMKKFSDLTEREVLAVAIASEEEDGRIYMSFAENLAERYAESARIFEQMAEEEKGHRHMLLELYEQRFSTTRFWNAPTCRASAAGSAGSTRPSSDAPEDTSRLTVKGMFDARPPASTFLAYRLIIERHRAFQKHPPHRGRNEPMMGRLVEDQRAISLHARFDEG